MDGFGGGPGAASEKDDPRRLVFDASPRGGCVGRGRTVSRSWVRLATHGRRLAAALGAAVAVVVVLVPAARASVQVLQLSSDHIRIRRARDTAHRLAPRPRKAPPPRGPDRAHGHPPPEARRPVRGGSAERIGRDQAVMQVLRLMHGRFAAPHLHRHHHLRPAPTPDRAGGTHRESQPAPGAGTARRDGCRDEQLKTSRRDLG
jgi:hypothetical protein